MIIRINPGYFQYETNPPNIEEARAVFSGEEKTYRSNVMLITGVTFANGVYSVEKNYVYYTYVPNKNDHTTFFVN